RAPDRLILVVRDRIEHQGQRPGWLVRRDAPPRRPWLRPAALLVALLLIALISATVIYVASPRPTPVPLPGPSIPAQVVPGATPPPIPLIPGNGWLATG